MIRMFANAVEFHSIFEFLLTSIVCVKIVELKTAQKEKKIQIPK